MNRIVVCFKCVPAEPRLRRVEKTRLFGLFLKLSCGHWRVSPRVHSMWRCLQ